VPSIPLSGKDEFALGGNHRIQRACSKTLNMSVNEVKIQRTTEEFQVRGTGHPGSRTFAIGNEDHTLGNALRHVLMQNGKVEFAGYSVPHPSEPVVHIRVQTNKKEDITTVDALKEACTTLYDQCAHVLEKLEEALPETREDRLKMEQLAIDEGYSDEEVQDNEDAEFVAHD
jgi:DNA-directed RNA polymerase I and III subunit RPAC2